MEEREQKERREDVEEKDMKEKNAGGGGGVVFQPESKREGKRQEVNQRTKRSKVRVRAVCEDEWW